MKFKQRMIVRQPPQIIEENKMHECNIDVKGCCCCMSKGYSRISTQFERTAYSQDEVCRVVADIDNTFCKNPIDKVQIHLVQNIVLNDNGQGPSPYSYQGFDPFCNNSSSDEEYGYSRVDFGMYRNDSFSGLLGSNRHHHHHRNKHVRVSGGTFTEQRELATKDYPGLPAHSKTGGFNKQMDLDLSQIHNNQDRSWIQMDQDASAMAEHIQPSVHGHLVQITYSLKVTCDHGTCCANQVESVVPLFIHPSVLKFQPQIEAPANWNPEVYPVANIQSVVPNQTPQAPYYQQPQQQF